MSRNFLDRLWVTLSRSGKPTIEGSWNCEGREEGTLKR